MEEYLIGENGKSYCVVGISLGKKEYTENTGNIWFN